MALNTGTAGFLRGPIVNTDGTISRDFLKYVQNLQTFNSQQQAYTVAALPTAKGLVESQTAFATNGRKVGEGAGAGTGVPVYWSNGAWRVYSTDQPVAA
jgi:hypothetical protein